MCAGKFIVSGLSCQWLSTIVSVLFWSSVGRSCFWLDGLQVRYYNVCVSHLRLNMFKILIRFQNLMTSEQSSDLAYSCVGGHVPVRHVMFGLFCFVVRFVLLKLLAICKPRLRLSAEGTDM